VGIRWLPPRRLHSYFRSVYSVNARHCGEKYTKPHRRERGALLLPQPPDRFTHPIPASSASGSGFGWAPRCRRPFPSLRRPRRKTVAPAPNRGRREGPGTACRRQRNHTPTTLPFPSVPRPRCHRLPKVRGSRSNVRTRWLRHDGCGGAGARCDDGQR